MEEIIVAHLSIWEKEDEIEDERSIENIFVHEHILTITSALRFNDFANYMVDGTTPYDFNSQ